MWHNDSAVRCCARGAPLAGEVPRVCLCVCAGGWVLFRWACVQCSCPPRSGPVAVAALWAVLGQCRPLQRWVEREGVSLDRLRSSGAAGGVCPLLTPWTPIREHSVPALPPPPCDLRDSLSSLVEVLWPDSTRFITHRRRPISGGASSLELLSRASQATNRVQIPISGERHAAVLCCNHSWRCGDSGCAGRVCVFSALTSPPLPDGEARQLARRFVVYILVYHLWINKVTSSRSIERGLMVGGTEKVAVWCIVYWAPMSGSVLWRSPRPAGFTRLDTAGLHRTEIRMKTTAQPADSSLPLGSPRSETRKAQTVKALSSTGNAKWTRTRCSSC